MVISNWFFMDKNYLKLGDLEVYKVAIELSNFSWNLYENFDWLIKKVTGNQFIRAIDSIGANIAEGFGRYHYKDKNKFYYNARESLLESKHWVLLLYQRKIINKNNYNILLKKLNLTHKLLNSFIKSLYKKININDY